MLDNVADPVLELSTVDVLRGASDLKDRVLLAISSGTPAVADLAYAVKVRVKEDFKIVEKVQGKRLANSTYDPRNLRDIVGLRIMTLYRLDALAIIPALFAAIKADTTETGPFDASSIEEIIIYSTNPTGDPRRPRYAKLTAAEEKAGLLDDGRRAPRSHGSPFDRRTS